MRFTKHLSSITALKKTSIAIGLLRFLSYYILSTVHAVFIKIWPTISFQTITILLWVLLKDKWRLCYGVVTA